MMRLHEPSAFGLEIVMRVSNAHRRELLQTLEGLRETVTRETRAGSCEILEDCMVPNRFYWLERWRNEEEVQASLDSERISMLMAAIRLLGSVETVKRSRLAAATSKTPSLRPDSSSAQLDKGDAG
jgi:quinol monooxygenase YgiN